jgi:fructose-1,6-bisphosphatase/inositol monophosphatase family enzyme
VGQTELSDGEDCRSEAPVTEWDVDARVEHVERAATAGAETALDAFETSVVPETKGGADRVVHAGDVVTAADRDAQRAVTDSIRERFPEDAVVGEEGDERKTVPESGVALVRAAGGVVTDLDGEPWTRRSTGLVASAGTAHEELLAVGRRMAGSE